MPAFNVKLEGAMICTGYVTIIADNAADAFAAMKVQVATDVDALPDPEWEFVDMKTVTDIEVVEVWDYDLEEVVFPVEDTSGGNDA